MYGKNRTLKNKNLQKRMSEILRNNFCGDETWTLLKQDEKKEEPSEIRLLSSIL